MHPWYISHVIRLGMILLLRRSSLLNLFVIILSFLFCQGSSFQKGIAAALRNLWFFIRHHPECLVSLITDVKRIFLSR